MVITTGTIQSANPASFAQSTEIKANNVERVIKTIKSNIYRYFTHAQSYNYIRELQKFAGSGTYHRMIGMPPNKVTKD